MDFIKKTLKACTCLQKGCAEVSADGDIIVPDVMPDILKILRVDGNAYITSSEVTGEKLTCEGVVDLKILYIPEDKDELLESISAKFDFTHVMNSKNLSDEAIPDLSADITRADFQLINSRKVKIKTNVSLSYEILSAEDIDISCDADEELLIETKKKSLCASCFVGFKDTQFLVRESLELPSGQASIDKILKLDVSVCDKEYKAINDRVVIKGTCCICALYRDSAHQIRHSDFEIPFTEIIDLNGITEDTVCDLDLSCGEVTYHTENDSDGDIRIIYTEVIVCAKLYAYDKMNTEYISDCFAPGGEFKCECDKREIEAITSSAVSSVSIREVIQKTSAAPKLAGIYNLIAKPSAVNAVSEDNRVCIDGKLECYCLYLCSGDEVPVYSIKKEIPFSCSLDAPGCKAGDSCRIICDVASKNFSLNSAEETEIKANLSLDVMTFSKEEIPIMSEFEICDIDDENKKGIVIYFVQDGDELWEIAKHYKVCSSAIAELNGLDDKPLCAGEKLLIPSC